MSLSTYEMIYRVHNYHIILRLNIADECMEAKYGNFIYKRKALHLFVKAVTQTPLIKIGLALPHLQGEMRLHMGVCS